MEELEASQDDDTEQRVLLRDHFSLMLLLLVRRDLIIMSDCNVVGCMYLYKFCVSMILYSFWFILWYGKSNLTQIRSTISHFRIGRKYNMIIKCVILYSKIDNEIKNFGNKMYVAQELFVAMLIFNEYVDFSRN